MEMAAASTAMRSSSCRGRATTCGGRGKNARGSGASRAWHTRQVMGRVTVACVCVRTLTHACTHSSPRHTHAHTHARTHQFVARGRGDDLHVRARHGQGRDGVPLLRLLLRLLRLWWLLLGRRQLLVLVLLGRGQLLVSGGVGRGGGGAKVHAVLGGVREQLLAKALRTCARAYVSVRT